MNETQPAGEGNYIKSWYMDGSPTTASCGIWRNPNSRIRIRRIWRVEDHTCAKGLGRPCVSTIDTDGVKSKNQDKQGIPPKQKQQTLFNLNRVETSTNVQHAQVEWSLLCASGVHEPDPCCTLFVVTARLTRALTLVHITSCVHPAHVPENVILSDPQHLSCKNSSFFLLPFFFQFCRLVGVVDGETDYTGCDGLLMSRVAWGFWTEGTSSAHAFAWSSTTQAVAHRTRRPAEGHQRAVFRRR